MSAFDRLPLHRKLVATALLVTTAAVIVAMAGLAGMDVWRFRQTAHDEALGLARILAGNLRAAITVGLPEEVDAVLETARARGVVRLACAYLADGSLYGSYVRGPQDACPSQREAIAAAGAIVVSAPVTDNADDRRVVGTVALVRDLSDLRTREIVTAVTALGLLGITAVLALVLSSRLQRSITGPLSEHARAARQLGRDEAPEQVPVPAARDEISELASAFNAMVTRVQLANRTLSERNEALRAEVEQRTQMQAEREHLLEREQRASRLKDEFLATVSHELRTPLNAILGWSQILTAAQPSQVLERGLDSIGRNARAQARVVEDLIDISRIVTGKLRLQVDAVDVRAVVSAAADVVRPMAAARGVHLVVELPLAPCSVLGDASRLQQVVWNLLNNAVKFTPREGSVTATVTCEPQDVVVSVVDTGLGISPQFLPHVFERFRQADGSLTREQGGLGLGLAIVKEVVELHGGTVTARSNGPGTGATFEVRLPTSRMAAAPGGSSSEEPAAPSLAGVHVLAVDDNADALDVVVAALTEAGAKVSVAQDGQQAVEQWMQHPADILLCDLAMPRMSGFEVLAQIREIDARAGRFTPALAISAHASEDKQTRSLRAGFLQHVVKPFQPRDLVRRVADIVARV